MIFTMGLKTCENIGFHFILILVLAAVSIDGSCTFPSYLTDVWYSSNGGTVTFSSTTFSNFKVASFGPQTFTCELSSGSQYVSKSTVFTVFNLPFVAYICMDLRYVSASKYIYYQPTDMLKDAEYARMKIYLNNTITVSSTADICDVTDYSTLMYHMLVRNNTISSEKIQCPNEFLGVFNYTYDTGSGNTCSGDTEMNTCDDKYKMTFDYSLCSTIQAFSAGGEVNCVYSSTSGSATFLHVFNLDSTTDESTYYRFTCYVIETLNNTIYATQYAQDCHYGQNATNVNTTGAYLTLEADYTCVTPTEETASAYIGIIIAIIIILLIIIIAIIFLLYMWKKKKDEKKRKEEEEERRKLQQKSIQEKIDNPDLRPEMDLGLPDDSKYNIDRLMYSDDKMVTPSNIEIERLRSQGFEGFDGFDDDYMDEFTRQNMIDASLFLDKRQRLEPIDEFDVDERGHSASFMKRFKELARSRIKRKKKRGSRSKKKKAKKDKDGNVVKQKKRLVLDLGTIDAEEWESDEEEGAEGEEGDDDTINIPGQVETLPDQTAPMTTNIQANIGSRSIMADKKMASIPEGKKKKKKKKKKKDFIEEHEDEEEDVPTPRLILPNLRPEKTDSELEKKQTKGSLAPLSRQPSLLSSNTYSSIRKAQVNNWTGHEDIELPVYMEDPKLKDLPPLQRVHRKKNPKLWSDILAKYGGDLNLGNDPSKIRLSENRWRLLLEELYTDKKYFDYMKKSAKHNPAERDVVGEAKEGLDFLQERAFFWKEQEPIPGRPPSYRSHSFAQSARSHRAKTPKKSKSFISSKSITDDFPSSSREDTDLTFVDDVMPKRKNKPAIHREKSKLSKEKSNLSNEKPGIIKERSFISKEKSDLSKPKIKRERSFLSEESPHMSPVKSPYDNSSKQSTPRPKKVHLPKIDDADKIYRLDLLPKTPLTQVRLEIDREESML